MPNQSRYQGWTTSACFFLFLSLVFSACLVVAGERVGGSELSKGEARVADQIADRSQVPTERLLALRSQGIGWGDIEIATVVAAATGHPLDSIVDLWYTGNQSWGVVAEEFGIESLGQLIAQRKRGPRADRD